jgi:hypothetical protein
MAMDSTIEIAFLQILLAEISGSDREGQYLVASF